MIYRSMSIKFRWLDVAMFFMLCLPALIMLLFLFHDWGVPFGINSGIPFKFYVLVFFTGVAVFVLSIFLKGYIPIAIFLISLFALYGNYSSLREVGYSYYAPKKYEKNKQQYEQCAQNTDAKNKAGFKICEEQETSNSWRFVLYDGSGLLRPNEKKYNYEMINNSPLIYEGGCYYITNMHNKFYFVSCFTPS